MMMQTLPRLVVRRDGSLWIAQTWAAFALALVLVGALVFELGSAGRVEQALLAQSLLMNALFAMVLSKQIRDQRLSAADSPGYRLLVGAGFLISAAGVVHAIATVAVSQVATLALALGWLFLLQSALNLAKAQRDRWEAELIEREQAPAL